MDTVSKLIVSPFRADLHCHSTRSDGSFSPVALIDSAVASGLSGLSITDHDTIDAYGDAVPYAASRGLLLGTGVELSCEYKKKSVHVLGYDFVLENEELRTCLKRRREKRVNRNRLILEKLKRLGIRIEEEELRAEGYQTVSPGRPHIAEIMLRKGYVRSIREAFQSYLGDEAPCFVRGETLSVPEAVALIKNAGGKPFLAHPGLYSDTAFVEEILAFGFSGLECFYGRFSARQEKTWLALAKKRGLLIGGGSDFHGSFKPDTPLGCSYVDEATFYAIFSSLASNRIPTQDNSEKK